MNIQKDYIFQTHRHESTSGIFFSTKELSGNPLIILIHGFNRFGGWELMWQARRLVALGYQVLLPSQLGFGDSFAERDYCGPETVNGIEGLIKQVISSLGVIPSHTILWGASRGASVALSILVHNDGLAFDAAILEAGVYDLQADYEWSKKDPEIKKNIKDETNATQEAFDARCPASNISNIKTTLLVMHGEEDNIISPAQSKNLIEILEKRGIKHEGVIIEGAGHHIGHPKFYEKYVAPFLGRVIEEKNRCIDTH